MIRFRFGKEYYEEPVTGTDEQTGEERIEYVTKTRDMIFEGDKAVKGSDYIRLYDAAGNETASFTGVSDFSGYELLEGEWSEPEQVQSGDYEGRIATLESENEELREAVEILLGGKDDELD